MDAARFDAIVRALAIPGSRRRALGAFLAVVAAALTPTGLEVAEGKKGKHHKNRKRTNDRAHDVGISAKKRGKKNKKCKGGKKRCGKTCVDLQTNSQHCGNCGVQCIYTSPNMECVDGACLCKPDFVFCGDPGTGGGVCTKLGTVDHCQRCGDACTGAPCESVTCDPDGGCQRTPNEDGEPCGNDRFCHDGACIDYGALATLKLPWCGGDREPRTLKQDWRNDHAGGGIPAIGFALDFGRSESGDEVQGTPVLAPMVGVLKQLPYDADGFGNHVRIDADNGWQVILAHLEQPSPVANNAPVQRGDAVGKLGNSGNSTAAHIHIEIRYGNKKPRGLFRDDAGDLPLFGYERDDFICGPDNCSGNDKAFTSAQRQCAADPCDGVDCSGLPHVEEASCSDGQCVIARCKPGFADCDGDPTTGCELGSTSAGTTSFRSATLVTTDGTPAYVNLQNCSVTDGLTCDRESETGYANLYFQNFGNLADFGIPRGATVTRVHVRVTGKSSHGYYVGLFRGSSLCYFPSDWWTVFGTSEIRTFTFSGPIGNSSVPRTVSSFCLNDQTIDASAFFLRVNRSSGQPWNAFIDNLEIAFDYNPPSSPICP